MKKEINVGNKFVSVSVEYQNRIGCLELGTKDYLETVKNKKLPSGSVEGKINLETSGEGMNLQTSPVAQ